MKVGSVGTKNTFSLSIRLSWKQINISKHSSSIKRGVNVTLIQRDFNRCELTVWKLHQHQQANSDLWGANRTTSTLLVFTCLTRQVKVNPTSQPEGPETEQQLAAMVMQTLQYGLHQVS